MNQFEFCYVDLIKCETVQYLLTGVKTTVMKRDKESGLSKKEVTGIEIAKLGLEGWELVSVNSDAKLRFFFKRRIN